MVENSTKKTMMSIEVSPGFEFFIEHWDTIEKLLRKYHNSTLFWNALVKSDPIYLTSKKTKNRFAKCTVEFESPLPWVMRKDKKPEECGDVYIDTMTFKKRGAPGVFVLESVQKGARISGIAILKSGRKPVRHEGDEYRANWVYGDYVYVNVYEVRLDRAAVEEIKSPYKEQNNYSAYNRPISSGQTVTDDDIIFNM